MSVSRSSPADGVPSAENVPTPREAPLRQGVVKPGIPGPRLRQSSLLRRAVSPVLQSSMTVRCRGGSRKRGPPKSGNKRSKKRAPLFRPPGFLALGSGSDSGSDSDSNSDSSGDGNVAVRLLPLPPRTFFDGAVEEWAASGGSFENEEAGKEALPEKKFPVAMLRAGQSGRVTVLEVTCRGGGDGGKQRGGAAGEDGGQREEMLEFRIDLAKKRKVPFEIETTVSVRFVSPVILGVCYMTTKWRSIPRPALCSAVFINRRQFCCPINTIAVVAGSAKQNPQEVLLIQLEIFSTLP